MRTLWTYQIEIQAADWQSTAGGIRKYLIETPPFDSRPDEPEGTFQKNIVPLNDPAIYYFFSLTIENIAELLAATEFIGAKTILQESTDRAFFPANLSGVGMGPSASTYNYLDNSVVRQNLNHDVSGVFGALNQATVICRIITLLETPARFFAFSCPLGYFDPTEAPGTPAQSMRVSLALSAPDYLPEEFTPVLKATTNAAGNGGGGNGGGGNGGGGTTKRGAVCL